MNGASTGMPDLPSAAPLTNWAGNVTFRAARLLRPESLDELRRAVAGSPRLRVLGTGHSFNRIADTEGDLLTVAGLPRYAQIDAERRTVTVAAGMRYAEVAAALRGSGLALANFASLPHISVAGAVATGTHGSGDGQTGLAGAVAGLRLVTADGGLVELSRAADPERFAGCVVSLGALGVVTDVTLDLVPAFEIAQYVYNGASSMRLVEPDCFDALFGSAYSVSLFTDWSGGPSAAWLKCLVPGDEAKTQTPDSSGLDAAPLPPDLSWLGAQPADGPRHPVPGRPAAFCSAQLGVPGPGDERLPHFRPEFTPSSGEELQSEFLLPRGAVPAAVRALLALGPRLGPVLQIAEVRTVAADGLWLSPAYGRDSAAFHFTWTADAAAVAPVLTAVEEALTALGARPHWGKLFTAPADQVAERYPLATRFAALRAEFDPKGTFRNAFIDAAFPPAAAD